MYKNILGNQDLSKAINSNEEYVSNNFLYLFDYSVFLILYNQIRIRCENFSLSY